MDANSSSLVGSIVKLLVLVVKVTLVYLEVVVNFFRAPARKSIKGENVLITGSGHGLGREMALKFANLGANLVLVDINDVNNQAVKQEILKNTNGSVKVITYSVDIREEAQVAELAAKVYQDLGVIHILVNNAGIVQCLPFLELSSTLVERTFQVNVLAHIWTIKHFLPEMLKRERGHIVAISSIAGLIGSKYLSDYCASKFAVVGLMESLEREIHDGGANSEIYFTTICPSCMSTGTIVDGVLTNKLFVVIPPISLFFQRLSNIIPIKVAHLMQEYLDYGVKPHSK